VLTARRRAEEEGTTMTTRCGGRRIIVGIDGSAPSRCALDWAVDEAVQTGGEIDAVLAYGSGLAWIDVGSDAQAFIIEHSAERANHVLHEVLDDVALPTEATVRIHPIVVEGEPARVLVEMAREADLLIVGTRGRGGFAGLLLGSVSQRCAEHSTCPVVVVPSSVQEHDHGGVS
jgi:nucleotide-binding universal stress UspA family protein